MANFGPLSRGKPFINPALIAVNPFILNGKGNGSLATKLISTDISRLTCYNGIGKLPNENKDWKST